MPARVARIRWKCPQCGKSRWMRPCDVKYRTYCSRECKNAAARVPHPVREKQAQKLARYGERACPQCGTTYEAKTRQQIYCSQPCATAAAQNRRRKYLATTIACETCGKEFAQRGGRAARFCSRECLYESMRGEKASHWKGGRHVRADGYVSVQAAGHASAHGHGGYVKEHRLVMEQQLGRALRPNETVHHRNGDRADNRIENLELWVKRHTPGQRVEDLVAWAKEILALYEPDIGKLAGG